MDIEKIDLKNFLNNFYETISFSVNEKLNKNGFRELFVPSAILIEKSKNEIIYKSVEEHINEFDIAVRNNPGYFINGFTEKQESYEIQKSVNYVIVKSHYSKTVTIDNKLHTSYGDNIFTLIESNKKLKIVSIAW